MELYKTFKARKEKKSGRQNKKQRTKIICKKLYKYVCILSPITGKITGVYLKDAT